MVMKKTVTHKSIALKNNIQPKKLNQNFTLKILRLPKNLPNKKVPALEIRQSLAQRKCSANKSFWIKSFGRQNGCFQNGTTPKSGISQLQDTNRSINAQVWKKPKRCLKFAQKSIIHFLKPLRLLMKPALMIY